MKTTMKDITDRADIVGECWIWKGAYAGPGLAYPYLGRHPATVRVLQVVGRYPEHLPQAQRGITRACGDRRCVRPDHLVLLNDLAADDAARFWARIDRSTDGCWLWTGPVTTGAGYGKHWFAGRTVSAHRRAWELTYGPIPEDRQINHTCDVRRCCNPRHMYLGTPQQNTDDREARGRSRPGHVRLTLEQVRVIRASREPIASLARQFGVSASCISAARRGITWSNV